MRLKGVIRAFRRVVLLLILVAMSIAAGVVLDRQILANTVPLDTVPASAASDFSLMAEAWRLIKRHYVDRPAIKPKRMTYAAISGMVDSLGDTGHSEFLTPEMVAENRDVTQGQFAGIGAQIQMKDKHVVVVAPMDGTPAQKAGLAPGDIIMRVDGKDVAGLSLLKVVNMIRGPAGTKVTLGIQHPHSNEIHDVTLTRAKIPLLSVWWSMLPGTHIADVRISMFSKGTTKALEKALDEAKKQGADALILDLRNDPGGLLEEAIGVASRFLESGDVLIEKNSKGQKRSVPVESDVPKWTTPMTVLINAGTASAAEIVSGALQDPKRATLIGETTFGTGTVLQEFPLSDGSALMLAVEEWLTPDGHVIWHKGITPNITVALPSKVTPLIPQEMKKMSVSELDASGDAQLLRARNLLLGHGAPTTISHLPRPVRGAQAAVRGHAGAANPTRGVERAGAAASRPRNVAYQ